MPDTVQINAYEPGGTRATGTLDAESAEVRRFALTVPGVPAKTFLAAGAAADLGNWRDSSVGWGLVAVGDKPLPACVAELVAARSAEVFRYLPQSDRRHTYLLNESQNRDVAIAGSPRGMGAGRLPYYLMILGGPDEVPWSIQFALAATRAVGRVPLSGQGLENYVGALLRGFDQGEVVDPYKTVTWATDLGNEDITHLMRNHLAAAVHKRFLADTDMGPDRSTFLDGLHDVDEASTARLIAALAQMKPGLVVTTSHGMTGPLSDLDAMRRSLGLPVGNDEIALDINALLNAWTPSQSIWYCHACCSAGSQQPSAFAPLFQEGSDLRRILDGIAALGPTVAPLPIALLGHAKPARAFIGHVEPTFDWTLRNPGNRQVVTEPFVEALYPSLYRVGVPVGQAFREVHSNIGGYLSAWVNARAVYDSGERSLTDLMAMRLAAHDLEALVVLGDPTALLPLRAA